MYQKSPTSRIKSHILPSKETHSHVRTPDGDGELVDKDASTRPLRVRLDDGMEAWFAIEAVRDVRRIRSRKKLSSSLFGLGADSAADSEALSQSGAEDSVLSVAAECDAGGGEEETLAQFATTSHAEAMRDAYGPYAGAFEAGAAAHPLTFEELQRACNISNLQIRLWPAHAVACNASMMRKVSLV